MTQASRAEKPRLYTEAELQAAIAAVVTAVIQPTISEMLSYKDIAKGCPPSNSEVARVAGMIATALDRVAKAQYAAVRPTDAMAALEAVKAQVRIDLMKDVLTAIYGGKVKAGLVDVRYDFARGSNADQRIEDVFNMEMAILARKGGE
jgi:hypothetical protein